MKILILSYEKFDLPIGLNTRLKGLIKALLQKGYSVEAAVPCYESVNFTSEHQGALIHHIRLPGVLQRFRIPIITRIFFVILFTSRFFKYFQDRNQQYSYLQAGQIYSLWACILLRNRLNAKVILDDPTMLKYLVESKLGKISLIKDIMIKIVEMFERYSMSKTDYVICSSKKSFDYFSRGQNAGKFFYLPNGVDLSRFVVQNKSFGNKLFFNASLPYYQNMAALRNLAGIIEVFQEKNFEDFFLEIIVNDRSQVPKDILSILNENDHVSLLSEVDNLISHLNTSDMVLLPYEKGHFLTAGSRLKAVEALACGKLVFSTIEGVDGLEGCQNDDNVILCIDHKDMAQQVMNYINKKDELNQKIKKIQANARSLVEESYSWEQLTNIYKNIIK